MNHTSAVIASAHRAWAGSTPKMRPTSRSCRAWPRISLMFHDRPPDSSTVNPFQKNCAASVAMIDGTPTTATIRPLMYPTRAPDANAATTASHGLAPCRKVQEKTKPEKAMIAEKLRSISPAQMTRVRPSASTSCGGTVWKNDM